MHDFPTETSPSSLTATPFQRVQYEATDDLAYHFSLSVPDGTRFCTGSGEPLGEDTLQSSLALLRGPESTPLWIEVVSSLMTREIAPADWLREQLTMMGYEILNEQRLGGRAGDEIDLLARHVDPQGIAQISRFYATKDSLSQGGGHVIFVRARATEEDYPALTQDMLRVVASLKLTHRSDYPYLEALNSFSRALPGDFLFFYPDSWTLAEESPEADGPDARTVHLHGTQEGSPSARITFLCDAGEDVDRDTIVERYLDSIRALGLAPTLRGLRDAPGFGDLTQTYAAEGSAGDPVDPMSLAAPAMPAPREMDVRLSIGTQGRAWYLIGMLGIAPKDAPGMAALNQRAFEIVRGRMRTVPIE